MVSEQKKAKVGVRNTLIISNINGYLSWCVIVLYSEYTDTHVRILIASIRLS